MGFFDNPKSKKKKTKTSSLLTTTKGGKVADLPVATVVPVSEQVPTAYPPQQQPPAVQQQQQYAVAPQQQQPTTPYTNMNMKRNNRITLDDNIQYKMNTIIGDRSCSHKMFDGISIIAGLTAINNIVGQGIALWFEGNKPMEVILRLYIIGLCSLAILIERESTAFVRDSPILMNWISRGLFYTFIGVLGENLYDVGYDNYRRRYNNNNRNYFSSSSGGYSSNNYGSNNYYNTYIPRMPTGEDCAEWYVWLVAWVMVGVGILYLIMGLFGLKNKYTRERDDYKARNHAIKNHQNGMPV